MSGNVGFDNLKQLALTLRDTYGLDTFIETGTWKGLTTEWASQNFKRVISIELDNGWYQRAIETFKVQKHVRLIHGDSAIELAKVLKRLKKPALIWLDAHWCKATSSKASECPLREELQAIKDSGIEHFILIDDARLFQNPPNSDWPTTNEIAKLLPNGYGINVGWNDTIIAVPHKAWGILRSFFEVKPPQKLEPVVLTSNAYLRCLPPFAYLFNKFWGKEQSVKVVRYEVRPYNLPANFSNYAIGRQENYTWSSGLIKFLENYEGELILLMLEDYFIDNPVKVDVIKRAWDRMLQATGVDKIDLTNDRLKVPHESVSEVNSFSDFDAIKSAPNAPFQASLQAAIWRVDFLKKILDPKENPWQFEKNGTKRIIEGREKNKFNGLILGFKQPPLSYINAVGGEGQNNERWNRKKFPSDMWGELTGRGLV